MNKPVFLEMDTEKKLWIPFFFTFLKNLFLENFFS